MQFEISRFYNSVPCDIVSIVNWIRLIEAMKDLEYNLY